MKHAVIYVFGLGDHRSRGQRLVVRLWGLYGVKSSVYAMRWREAGRFDDKVAGLLEHIDRLNEQGYAVSLIGTSAGASAAINVYARRPDSIHRVVCICGKLRNAQTIHPATYAHNQAFGESLALLPDSLGALGKDELARVLSIRPLRDNIVPPADTVLPGAQQRVIPTAGHVFSIAMAITFYSFPIVRFIRKP